MGSNGVVAIGGIVFKDCMEGGAIEQAMFTSAALFTNVLVAVRLRAIQICGGVLKNTFC